MKLPKLHPNIKIVIIAAGVALGVFLMDRLVFSAMRAKIRNLDSRIKAAEADLKIGLELQKRKDEIQKECAAYKGYLDISADEAEQKIIARFINEVENTAKEAGVSIVNLTAQEHMERQKGYKICSLELRAEASFGKVRDFLYKIQTSRSLIRADRFVITSKDPQSGNFKLDTTISMTVL
jgi:hypothetical protein